MKKHLVVALAYDQLCTFEMGCAIEIFALPRPELNLPWYEFKVCAAERGAIQALGGIRVQVPNSLKILEQADTIIIPGWSHIDAYGNEFEQPPSSALLNYLRAAYRRGARICSICSGVFLLAATGLLDGKSATTHWKYAERLSEKFPRIRVQPNALYVDEGQIITSAGSAAGIDMMLHMVRSDHGSKVANIVAQRLVVAPHRTGDQAQFIPSAVQNDEAGRLSKLMEWIHLHPTQKHTLKSMAERALMSPRHLQRKFLETTNMTPITWLTHTRIGIAKERLEMTREPIIQIAENSGFGSEESFRKHFRVLVGVSPSAYRNQFGKITM